MPKPRRYAMPALVLLLTLFLVSGAVTPSLAERQVVAPQAAIGHQGPPAQQLPGMPPDAQSTTGPLPPPGLHASEVPVDTQAAVVIPGVPSYEWRHGCGPTAVGMVLGYWDGMGYAALVDGSASSQTSDVNRMIASGDGAGDVATNYTDYCLPMDSGGPIQPDRSEPPEGDEHPDHCVADFMLTSQSARGNEYGWSYLSDCERAMTDYVDWLGRPDYLATTRRYYMYYTPQLTWDVFRAEIDAGRPMVFLVDSYPSNGDGWTDHFVTAVGYDDDTHTYGFYDTYDHSVHWRTFASMAYGQPWGIYSGIAFQPSIVNPGMQRVTVAQETGRDSESPALNGDGTLLVFSSDADLLDQGIGDEQYEIWLTDRTTRSLVRVTSTTDANHESWSPAISADGGVVAFHGDADLLGQDVPDGQYEVWLYDTQAITYTRVTTASHADRDSTAPALNADGTVVAFLSDSDLLGQGNVSALHPEVWLYDTGTMTYTCVTTAAQLARQAWGRPALDASGTVVAFSADHDLLNQGIADEQYEIWLYDTQTMTYTRVTTASHPERDSYAPSLSADGTKVVFYSDADLLGQGNVPDDQFEVWLYDTQTMTYTRITTATTAGRDSVSPAVSADGLTVVFAGDADLLGQGITGGQSEIWVYDIVQVTYSRVTWASEPDRDSYAPALSGDGETLAFYGDSDILAQNVPDEQYEVWLRRVERVWVPAVSKGLP